MIAAALDSNVLGLAFLRGMVASINPCGFVLLPTYLLFFLGVQAAEQAGDQRASVRRALVVGTAVSAGFVAVFLVVGIVTETIDSWLLSNAKYATVVIGVAFIVLGVAMLAGYRPRFATPHLDAGGRTRSVGSMFVYGIAYAVASLGCTMPLFIPTVFGTGRREGFAAGVASAVFYGAGMGLVVIALTVSLAGANQLLLGALRSAMRYVDLIAAAFLVLSGVYLIYYFTVVDVGEDTTSITDSVGRLQARLTNTLAGRWELIAIVLAAVVGAALVFVTRRPRPGPAPSGPTESS
ncbi:MAG: putative cytochrome c biosis protein [Desertimonas sp.]|nr:putative cytochrome c biosis protein [Desertimonas sp.]